MLEKPALHDDTIIACIRRHYDLPVSRLTFLPIGNDATAWVYRVQAGANGYFLKVKNGSISQASLAIPRFLNTSGIPQVVAPLPTVDQTLSQPLDDFTLILYPFIEGRSGMEKGLSDAQWIEMGAILNKIHSMTLPDDLFPHIARETFVPAWGQICRELHSEILIRIYDDPFEKALGAFWQEKQDQIISLVERSEALGQQLHAQSLDFVLCHCDIHTANVLVDQDEQLHIVDWDAPMLAPRERDLMFMVESDRSTGHAETLFRAGYGPTPSNQTAIAYYRYEWVVQEIGDFGARVFRMSDIGAETKRESVEEFKQLFRAGSVVEAAYQSDF